jgi:hypothetical protein
VAKAKRLYPDRHGHKRTAFCPPPVVQEEGRRVTIGHGGRRLLGSVKQVAWADDIRAGFLAVLNGEIARCLAVGTDDAVDKVRRKQHRQRARRLAKEGAGAARITSAPWWIAIRNLPVDTALAKVPIGLAESATPEPRCAARRDVLPHDGTIGRRASAATGAAQTKPGASPILTERPSPGATIQTHTRDDVEPPFTPGSFHQYPSRKVRRDRQREVRQADRITLAEMPRF